MDDSEMTVEELKEKMDRKDPIWVLDVREKNEYEISRIAGSTLIPLGELPRRLDEIPRDAPEIAVYCKMGGRSARAVGLLREKGFPQARNVTGGVLAWSDRIDPTQPKY